MSTRCPQCGSFMPTNVCSTCGHRQRNRERIGLWIALGVLAAIALALATFGIARPLLANDPPAADAKTTTTDTAEQDPRAAIIDSLRELGRALGSSGIIDLNAVRAAARSVQATKPDPLIANYAAVLLAFVDDSSKTSFAAVQHTAEEARIAAPNDAPGVLAAFDPAALNDGTFTPEQPPAERRMSGWVQPASGGVACMLAVQEVTCITQGGQVRILTGAGDVDEARWAGTPWPATTQRLPPEGALSPDGQVECTSPSPTVISCTAVVTRDLPHPSTITVPT